MSGPQSGLRDFIVVGAGPVGLLCAVALRRAGRTVTVLEQHTTPSRETRSIGIHAAALAGLDRLGLLEAFVARGVRITRGHAIGDRGLLGQVSFGSASRRHGYALAIPQAVTEALLAAEARALGVEIIRGARVCGLARPGPEVIAVDCPREQFVARHLLGCDGSHSEVRRLLGIGRRRSVVPGSFMMAEFPNLPALGHDAYIYLSDEGLVESFPLPGDRRRWVVEAPGRREQVELAELCALVFARCGVVLDANAAMQVGGGVGVGVGVGVFGVVQALADRFDRGRALLLGDAAHVLSPFGGQGMNLGWLDGLALADRVTEAWGPAGLPEPVVRAWARDRRRAAQSALRQAGWNTRLGRRGPVPRLRNAVVRLALSRPFVRIMARRFAMLHLQSSPAV